jgi:ABC-type sugar transport system permease subunit/ABC-type glycerol-3-phosphate transport system substrate-binding protein
MIKRYRTVRCKPGLLILLLLSTAGSAADSQAEEKFDLRLWYMPELIASSYDSVAAFRVIDAFKQQHPEVILRKTSGIKIPQIGATSLVLMAIAGGVAPDMLEFSSDNVHDFVQQNFLVPLDDYVKDLDPAEMYARAPKAVWDAARIRGPDGVERLYAIPTSVDYSGTFDVTALKVRFDLLAKRGIGMDSMPTTWDALYQLCQDLSDPGQGIYGIGLKKESGLGLAKIFQTFLVGAGGRAMERRDGKLYAAYDSDEAVLAVDFIWKLVRQPWERDGKRYEGVAVLDHNPYQYQKRGKVYFDFWQMSERGMMIRANGEQYRLAPMPRAPNGHAVPTLRGYYTGVFAGQTDERIRQAAFDYIWHSDSDEARRIRSQTFIEKNEPTMANPADLQRFGYEEALEDFPSGYLQLYTESVEQGFVEQTGAGAAEIIRSMNGPVQQALIAEWATLSTEQRHAQIRRLLTESVAAVNNRLHNPVSPERLKVRKGIALVVVLAIFGGFLWQIWLVQRAYADRMGASSSGRRTTTSAMFRIVAILCPALGLITLWEYYPLLQGAVIAFQDYQFLGDTRFVGVDNFMEILFAPYFWAAMWRTVVYVFLSLLFGFFTPIILAVLLSELPRGTVIYRIIYYLPALTSGIVVMFLWKAFYEPGANGYLNYLLSFINVAPKKWLEDPNIAMLCCVMPVVWAGIGPASLIYQAAMKSIPTDLFEAAAMDGAGFFGRLQHVVVPYMKPLIIINFVGVFIGTFKSTGYILVLTGGGPAMATTVVSLEIFYEAYARLSFGTAIAMSWVLAASLIAFTLFQIKYLSKVEFRSAGTQ